MKERAREADEAAQNKKAREVRMDGAKNIHNTVPMYPIYVFPEKELRGLSPNFHIHVPVSNLYIPRICYWLQQISHIDPENIYKSPTDTWMEKLGEKTL